jgi:hypothetical protein
MPEAPVSAPEKYALYLEKVDLCRPGTTLRVDTPEFQPRAPSPSKNLAQAANAAVFVPRSQGSTMLVTLSRY